MNLPIPLNKANKNTDGYLGSDDFTNFVNKGISSAIISLTSAQILELYTTPISLLPTLPNGQVYQILSVIGSMTYKTAAYATETEIDIVDTTTGDVLFSDVSTLLAATANTIAQIQPTIASNVAPALTPAGSISITSPTANPVTGAGSLKIYFAYTIITL